MYIYIYIYIHLRVFLLMDRDRLRALQAGLQRVARLVDFVAIIAAVLLPWPRALTLNPKP